MKYSDSQIVKRVETTAKGFAGWKSGVFDIWVRSSADVLDAFDDKVYTFEAGSDGIPQFVMVCSGTSNAGSYGLKHFDQYNAEGCAVLESDRIVYGSHEFGTHKGYPAYRQAKAFPYYRDADRNDKADENGKVHNDIIFANCHRAASVGQSVRIYNWSVACLVRNVANEWNSWLRYMDGRPLTVCILKEF